MLTLPAPPAYDAVNGDFEDYDPEAIDLEPAERQDEMEMEDVRPEPGDMAVIRFELDTPSQLSTQALKLEFQASIDRILQSIRILDKSVSHRAGMVAKSATLDSLAFNEWDKEAWITLLSRLCARATNPPDSTTNATTNLPNVLRERIFEYIMIDFREHLDLAISWLTEEWYNDTLSGQPGVYNKWATRIFDNIIPFIEGKDPKDKDFKIFLRFLGDLPLITPLHVQKLRTLCLDPERQKLGFAAIKYLLLLRPPARDACIELCVDLFKNRMFPLFFVFCEGCVLIFVRCRYEERCLWDFEEMGSWKDGVKLF